MRICLLCEGIAPDEPAEAEARSAPAECAHCAVPLLSEAEFHFPVRRGEADAAHPMLGRRIGAKYRITGVLGRGGMGTVFRAVHELSDGVVAIKILHPRFARRSEYREALRAEARKASQVVHDHCARVLDVGEFDDGAIFLAMEMAEGETLADRLAHTRPDPATAVEILRQTARALVGAHSKGLVHGDLSARNIMLSVRDGLPWIKVLDFGIARGGVTRGDDSLSPKGEVAGFANPAYAAPEQLSGVAFDARADLYSLGVLAHEMLTGKVPIEGRTTREVSQALARGPIEPMPRMRGVPRRLRRLVDRLLAKDPADRPESAAVVVEELEAIQRPGGRAAAAAAAVAGVGAVALAAAAAAARPDAFLASRPGAGVLLAASIDRNQPAQVVTSARLEGLDLTYGGFQPQALALECLRDGASLWTRQLEPRVADEGVLTLDGPDWRAVVVRLEQACAQGAVDLQFAVPGLEPLGQARLLVDDDAPALDLALRGVGGGVVGASEYRLRSEDRSGLAAVAIELEVGAGGRKVFPLASSTSEGWSSLLELLGVRFPGVVGYGDVRLRATARDRADNVAETPWTDLPRFDLRCSSIEAVHGAVGGATVFHDGSIAALRVDVSHREPGLSVELRSPSGRTWVERNPEPVGDRALEVRWSPGDHESKAPFEDGEWGVVLIDPAGNRSAEFRQPLRFRRRAIEAALEPVGATIARWSAGTLALEASTPGAARLRCAPLWTPQSATFVGDDGRRVSAAGLEEAVAGGGLVRWNGLDAGRWSLSVELVASTGDGGAAGPIPVLEERTSFPVLAVPTPCTVLIPDSRELRYLNRVLAADVLAREGDALLPGTAWRFDPALDGAIRVTAFAEREGGWEALDDGDGVAAIPLRRGRQIVAYRFEDALGRPARVDGGLGWSRQVGDGVILHGIAEFGHHDAAPRVVYREVLLEHGQAARVVVSSPLHFESADHAEIVLGVGQAPVRVRTMRPAADGSLELVFDVPFSVMERAAGLTEVERSGYADGLRRTDVPARLQTPAGSTDLTFDVRTSRSLLAVVGLDAVLADGHGVELGALDAIRWVPIPAPDEPFADPVPRDISADQRARFRSLPELAVRNLPEIYLMADELSRGAYEVLRGWSAEASLPRERFAHALDPMGAERATPAGLLPHGWDEAAWTAAVAADPHRAVASVDGFQAYTAARLMGWGVLGDPSAFRLPLGVELERAVVLGVGAGADGIAAKGLAWQRKHERWAEMRLRGQWPPTAAENVEVSDVHWVSGGRLTGLQFGVSEWVADLPFGGPRDRQGQLVEWLRDAELHLEKVGELARGEGAEGLFGRWFGQMAVIRGQPLGSDLGGVTVAGHPCFPGVLRAVNVRRDGRDPVADRTDRRLAGIGIRWVGTAPFLRAVRSR